MIKADAEGGKAPFCAVLGSYLSSWNRDDPGQGCPISALATDASRQGAEMQAAYAEAIIYMTNITDAEVQAAVRVLLDSGQLRTDYEVEGTHDLLVTRMLDAAAKVRKSAMKLAEAHRP